MIDLDDNEDMMSQNHAFIHQTHSNNDTNDFDRYVRESKENLF